jgi:hypothetical protein
VILQAPDSSGAIVPLKHVWVYWKQDSNITLLRSDGAGRLFNSQIADKSFWWEYNTRFSTSPGRKVEIYYSRGAKPIPNSLLNGSSNIFFQRTVPPPSGSPPPTSTVGLPNILLQLTRPEELSLWPLLLELPRDDYPTQGMNQGTALWTHPNAAGNLTVTENSAAQAPLSTMRPRERGLKIEGNIDSRATGIRIQVLDSNGNAIQLHDSIAATVAVQEINGTIGSAQGNVKSFEAAIFFADAANAFGQVQIFLRSDGIAQPIIEVLQVQLCGFQIALVDDHEANTNGQQRGPVKGENEEKIIVDFLNSPEQTLVDLSAQTRSRRMVTYDITNHQRLLNPSNPLGANNPMVIKPQMPMWMIEFQVIGITEQQFRDLIIRRYFRDNSGIIDPFTPHALRIELRWSLTLSWDGPDVNSPSFSTISRHNQTYQYSQSFDDTQNIQLFFDHNGQSTDSNLQRLNIGNHGEIPDALVPAPTTVAFPVNSRRLPMVIVRGQQRSWGRQAGAPQKDTLMIEWQPRLVDTNNEIIRGGDGILQLRSISINGQRIHGGLLPDTSGRLVSPPTTDPDIRLPVFRIRGSNPDFSTQISPLIDALVGEFFNANAAQTQVALLPLDVWQITARSIIRHESNATGNRHFEHRGARRTNFGGVRYGLEQDMPIFGPPHGYGISQLDFIFARGPNSDEVWSFVENIRSAVRVIMQEKAQAAHNHFNTGAGAGAFAALPLRRRRAMFRREVVRRYNGGREFDFQGGNWVINTNVSPDRQDYPNNVLGTHVAYPGPTNFAEADFGQGL